MGMIVYRDGVTYTIPEEWLASHDRQIKNDLLDEILDYLYTDVYNHSVEINGKVVKSYPTCKMMIEHLEKMRGLKHDR